MTIDATARDPMARFRRWLDAARRAGALVPEAMALATVDGEGRPSVRFMMLKAVDERGFVFYTDVRSRKGDALKSDPRASFAIYWESCGRQIRVEGSVEEVSASEAQAYWAMRPRLGQLVAAVSRQSAKLRSRQELNRRFEACKRKSKGREVPRPSHWTGFRLLPRAIEFLDQRTRPAPMRELYVRRSAGWTKTLLQP